MIDFLILGIEPLYDLKFYNLNFIQQYKSDFDFLKLNV
jgi:hypothetical protein